MKYICAWCTKVLKIEDTEIGIQDNKISHGICKDCEENLNYQDGVELNDYIKNLKYPVIVVNNDVVVYDANKNVLKLLKKDIDQIKGNRGGIIFECAHSRLPGGCGKTIHCSGCAIRNSVKKTYETGESIIRVPAYLQIEINKSIQEIHFYITTMKYEEFVLLKIEDV